VLFQQQKVLILIKISEVSTLNYNLYQKNNPLFTFAKKSNKNSCLKCKKIEYEKLRLVLDTLTINNLKICSLFTMRLFTTCKCASKLSFSYEQSPTTIKLSNNKNYYLSIGCF